MPFDSPSGLPLPVRISSFCVTLNSTKIFEENCIACLTPTIHMNRVEHTLSQTEADSFTLSLI